jgi:large subunit ribosomal protein L32
MAVPKRRKSQSRTRTRRAHDAATPVNFVTCENCGEPRLPHRMCGHCGHYRGRAIKEVEET